MARGEDTSRAESRRIGRPRPTPYFQLGDSARKVAEDWASGENSALYRFASAGVTHPDVLKEVDFNLQRGDTDPREKERLSNLRKHVQLQLEEQ